MRHIRFAVIAILIAAARGRRLRQEEAAGRAAAAAAARRHVARPPPRVRPLRPSRCPRRRRSRRSRRSQDDPLAGRRSRHDQQELAVPAGVLPARQLRGRRRRPAGAEHQRGILKKYPSWVITIEGHCDERGTAEYNLALGEKRALAAKTYLVSLGVPADRSAPSATARSFPSIRDTTKARGRRTAAPTSWSRASRRLDDIGHW